MSRNTLSTDSLTESTRTRARFSGHGGAKGDAGVRADCHLSKAGQEIIVNPQEGGFENFTVGVSWDPIFAPNTTPILKWFRPTIKTDVDVDLACLYELEDGSRGALQALGDLYGRLDGAPFIKHSGDERTGDKEGDDEWLTISGKDWPQIKRILIYLYIYEGAPNWNAIKPQIFLRVPGEENLLVTLKTTRDDMPLCAVAMLENVRNGIRLVNHAEYYPGQTEMDRAFGFGLQWDDGRK